MSKINKDGKNKSGRKFKNFQQKKSSSKAGVSKSAKALKRKGKILEEDFTGGAIHELSSHRGSTGDATLDKQISELVSSWGVSPRQAEMIEELVVTSYRISHDKLHMADLKLINRSLKELRVANSVFLPYRHKRKISIYGSARTTSDKSEYKAAVEFARKMTEKGFMTITGAGEGIMGAAQMGAGRKDSFGLNIALPFEQGANKTITGDKKLIEFNYFFTRKLSFVKESHAFAHFPGGLGTMDECFETLTLIQTGKSAIVPIVMVDAPGGVYWKTWRKFIEGDLLRLGLISPEDISLYYITDNIDDAVEQIVNFYKNFHSYRFVGDRIVLRLHDTLSSNAVDYINNNYTDMLKDGSVFKQGKALKAEYNERDILDLPRLYGRIHRRNFARIRQLIDYLNKAPTKSKDKQAAI